MENLSDYNKENNNSNNNNSNKNNSNKNNSNRNNSDSYNTTDTEDTLIISKEPIPLEPPPAKANTISKSLPNSIFSFLSTVGRSLDISSCCMVESIILYKRTNIFYMNFAQI